jgi:hypothetical protein
MPPQTINPGNPAPASTAPSAAQPAQAGAPPSVASTPANPNPPAPQPLSGTWFQEDDPRILIQWSLTEASTPGNPSYTAQVRIYQQIFDTEFPAPPFRGPVVPFSVADPSVGTAPFLQGSLALSPTNPPILEVVNLRFPGFSPQSLTLFPSPTVLGSGSPSTPAGPATGGGASAPGASPAGSSQPAAAGTAAQGNPAA